MQKRKLKNHLTGSKEGTNKNRRVYGRNNRGSTCVANFDSNNSDHSTKSLSQADKFDARKVIIRIGIDGEPCASGTSPTVRFEAFYFLRWLSFDDNQPRQYAECSREPFVEYATGAEAEQSIRAKRRFSHMASHSCTHTIPVAAVYFIHADLATRCGLDPDPGQDSFFPELVTVYDGPIQQPFGKIEKGSTGTNSVIKGNRVSLDDLGRICTVGNGLEVRISRIPNAGRGVFTNRNFRQGELVTLYFGHAFGEAHRKLLQQEGRGTHAKPVDFKHRYLDGVKTVFNGMHAGQLLNQGTPEACNCDWATLELWSNNAEKVLAIRATRDILAGEELYVSYGKKYWDELEMTPNEVPALRISQSS